MGKRVAVYLRVSKTNGEQTVDNQRPEVEQLASTRGEVVARYEEQGSAVKHRPHFEAMLADAKRGRFDVLVVWALDRFGRSMFGNMQDVLELDRLGVQVVSVREPWLDTDGPVRPLLVAIFSWAAEQERNRLIERTRAGLARARRFGTKSGKPIGRAKRWVDVDEARRLIDEEHVSQREAARRMGVALGTLQRALARKEAAHP
jgi:putative DNA-invertase from lambdoid prophage Rac